MQAGLLSVFAFASLSSCTHASWIPPRVPEWVHRLESTSRERGMVAVAARRLEISGVANYSGIIRVCEYVRDSTGHVDVADQMQELLDQSWKTAIAVGNRTIDNSTFPLGIYEPDLGGLRFDLCGAHYLLSKPLRFPPGGGGNMVLSNGALHADPNTFPIDSFVVQVDGIPIDGPHAVRYRYLTFENLELDGAHRAAGCLLLIAVEEIRVFQTLCTGFTQRGIWTRGQNNEVFILQSWFKEFSDRNLCHSAEAKTGAAIWLDGNDHSIDDVVVFCSKHGVTVNGSATAVRNLHVYTETPSVYPLGGVWVSSGCAGPVPGGAGGAWDPPVNGTIVPGGVSVKGVRIQNCYFDGCPVVIDNPEFDMVTGSLFLVGRGMASPGQGGVVLVPHKASTPLVGLQVTGNVVFGGVDADFPFVYAWESAQENRNFVEASQVLDTVVDGNAIAAAFAGKQISPSTTRLKIARKFAPEQIAAAGNTISVNLTDTLRNSTLLLRGAAHVQYSLRFEDQSDLFLQHALVGASVPPVGVAGTVVAVALQRAPVGAVTVDLQLDQSTQQLGRLAGGAFEQGAELLLRQSGMDQRGGGEHLW